MPIKDILVKYSEEIEEFCKYEKDLVEHFGYYNILWVFEDVAKQLDYKIFMAEAENVGYKRTKRGEKVMPNDLYDEEIAPLFIDAFSIFDEYEDQIQIHKTVEKNLKDKISVEEKRKEKANKKKLDKLNSDLIKIQEVLVEQQEELNRVKDIIVEYYQDTSTDKGWKIKDEYTDRLDQELLFHFTEGLLSKYKSSDVLLREESKIKILDYFRKEVIW